MRSARRPGQATTMSARLRRAATCGPCGVPPKMAVTLSPMACASGERTARTWVASSRVGTSTRPRGRHAIVYPPGQPDRERDAERERLPGAGLGPPENVEARQGVGQRSGLDGERHGDAVFAEGVHQGCRYAQVSEGNDRSRNQLGALFPLPDRSRLAEGRNYGLFYGQSGQDNGLQELRGRVVEGATSVETSSLTERQTTGAPSWRRHSVFSTVPHAILRESGARALHQRPFESVAEQPGDAEMPADLIMGHTAVKRRAG